MLIDARAQKYSVVKVFIKEELLQAEKSSGEVVLDKTDEMHMCLKNIESRCTKILFHFMPRRYGKDLMYQRGLFYWNTIYKTLETYFKPEEPYIPAILSLQLLQIYKEKGHTDFFDYDFVDLLSKYEKFKLNDKEHRQLISKHMRCAIEIAENLDKSNYKVKRK